MAVTSQVIGTLGAGKITESAFWFSNSRRYCSDISKSWSVPAGDYLFAWYGTAINNGAHGTVIINGQSFAVGKTSETGKVHGGYVILRNVTAISVTGSGTAAFSGDPVVTFVRIAPS